MRFAICDDENLQLDILDEAIRGCPLFANEPLVIERFASGVELLQSFKTGVQYDFVFLDIHMPQKNGLDTYHELTLAQNTKVIFVSTHAEKLPEVFALHTPCFLFKPYNQDTFFRTVRTVIANNSHEYLFNCTREEKRYVISSKQIRYIEVYNHNLIAHTDKEFYLERSSLDELGNILLSYGFFRCHRSFLINLNYYRYHNATTVGLMTIKGLEKIPLGRERKSKIDGAILKYKTRGGRNDK